MRTRITPRPDAEAPPPRRRLARAAGGLATMAAAGWLGLHVRPDPLPPPAVGDGQVPRVPLPANLPAPVTRFLHTLYGDHVPVVESAMISGHGTMRVAGITFPARFRFSHLTGRDYRHDIELTVLGAPIITVTERFVDGHARLELPLGVSEGPNIDQGANLALWAEAVWMPSVWVTDARARWDSIDGTTATLTVPFGQERETFVVRFDHDTGLLSSMESLRFKGDGDEVRTRWLNHAADWRTVGHHPVPRRTSVTWADEGSPWARLTTDHVVYNADLDEYVRPAVE